MATTYDGMYHFPWARGGGGGGGHILGMNWSVERRGPTSSYITTTIPTSEQLFSIPKTERGRMMELFPLLSLPSPSLRTSDEKVKSPSLSQSGLTTITAVVVF